MIMPPILPHLLRKLGEVVITVLIPIIVRRRFPDNETEPKPKPKKRVAKKKVAKKKVAKKRRLDNY